MTNPIFTGLWGKAHIQGIAIDSKKGYIYYSFTTKLIKATLDGEIVGSVDGLLGHLGCIAFNERDGKVYGSLEYKNDRIGRGILSALDSTQAISNAFYIAIFDVDKIDRLDMSAETDGVMKCVYLKEVIDDYSGEGKDAFGQNVPHKYGCSGIDGTTFAPLPACSAEDGMYLYVAYGIYSDASRDDNDHQVILCYDVADWDKVSKPLKQDNMHTDCACEPMHKFFVYTGNTTFGVQNLEYDKHKKALFMAVYKGAKPQFPNYDLYIVDMSKPALEGELLGVGEKGELLALMQLGEEQSGIYGWRFPYGSTGLYSYGDGRWMISHNGVRDGQQFSQIFAYTWDDERGFEKLI